MNKFVNDAHMTPFLIMLAAGQPDGNVWFVWFVYLHNNV
jgi:hypothetical protein